MFDSVNFQVTDLQALAALSSVILVVILFRRSRRFSISHIPGPKPKSKFFGSVSDLLRSPIGDLDVKWARELGPVYRLTAPFDERLFVSDPITIRHLFASGSFDRPALSKPLSWLTAGPGILYAEGHDHTRQRRVMQPAFAMGPLKSLVPLFTLSAQQMGEHWKKEIEQGTSDSAVINVADWLARATLDVIGHAAFDYNFNSLENDHNELSNAFHNMIKNIASPSNGFLLVQSLFGMLPSFVPWAFVKYARNKDFDAMREIGRQSKVISSQLVDQKTQAYVKGQSGRDVMSLLVHANLAAEARNKMAREELLASMSTIIGAGHGTTATQLTWTLYTLAQRQDVQSKARAEIKAARDSAMATKGHAELSYDDFDNLKYLTAVIKEMLRFLPIVRNIGRQPNRDEVLPLSRPLKTVNGEMITEIPISKGQVVMIDIYAYNHSKELWGEDADEFRPERWLDKSEKATTGLGVYGNLMTFGMGHRACLGFRFSLIEMQTFLIELLSAFEFSLPSNGASVGREGALLTIPFVKGQREKGMQMPLSVKSLDA